MKAKKRFGQNFLQDGKIAEDIANAAEISSEDSVWEIGPGKGILTNELIKKKPKQLTCFEIDRDIIPYLEKKFAGTINLLNVDILKVDWLSLLTTERYGQDTFSQTDSPGTVLAANIPYNITSPVLEKICTYKSYFKRIVLMMQKEVAERLSSSPGKKSYGVLTIKIQYSFNVEALFKVTPDKFRPQPKVESMVVKLEPRYRTELAPRTTDGSDVPDSVQQSLLSYNGRLGRSRFCTTKPSPVLEQGSRQYGKIVGTGQCPVRTLRKSAVDDGQEGISFFWKIVETAFHSRRKTLGNNLKLLLSAGELEQLAIRLNNSGERRDCPYFNLKNRGEELSEEDFIYLYHTILDIRRNS